MPLSTVSSSTRNKTSQLATSQTASAGVSQTTITERQPLEKSTKTGPAPTKSTFSKSASLLFYVTLALISVFVISFLIYIFSYLRKFVISKREIKSSDLQIKNTGNSIYECVDFRQHMWKALLSKWENVLKEVKYSVQLQYDFLQKWFYFRIFLCFMFIFSRYNLV